MPSISFTAPQQIAFADHAEEFAGVINDGHRADAIGEQKLGNVVDIAISLRRKVGTSLVIVRWPSHLLQ